jgi:hypothetical protein
MNLLAESFRRQLIVKNVKNWFSNNIRIFAPSQQVNNNSIPAAEISTSEDENIVIVEPTVEPVVEPVVEPFVEPTVEPFVEPVVEPVVEPFVEPTVEPVVEPTVEPFVEPVVEPFVEPFVEPVIEPIVVTSEVPEVLETTEKQDIEEQIVIEPQKTKKGRKKKTA